MSLNNTQNNTQMTLNKFYEDMEKIQLNNHPNKNYYIENYEYICCFECGFSSYEEEDYEDVVVCNTCNHLHCKTCYYKYFGQDRCLKCHHEKEKYKTLMICFNLFIQEVKIDGFLLDNELSIFNKPKNDYKFSNLMRILFNEYKIEFWDDDERRLKDRTNALLVFKNMKKYIPYDIQRHLITNYL